MFFLQEYGAQQIKAVLFFRSPAEGLVAKDAWNIIRPDDNPEFFVEDKKTPQQLSTCSGRFNDRLLNITSQVGRLDVFFNPAPTESLEALGNIPPSIPNFDESIKDISNILGTITSDRLVVRLGVIVELVRAVPVNLEGDSLRSDLCPLELPKNLSEISLRFNGKRKFTELPDIEMNRLVAWQNGKVGRMTMNLPFQMGPANPTGQMAFDPIINLKIDVNSAAETPFRRNEAAAIVSELCEEVRQIKLHGMARFTE